jgi:hypothetical protein
MTNLLKTYRPKLVVEVHHGVDRHELLTLIKDLGYSPKGIPIEPIDHEIDALYIDDKSYAFQST